MANKKNNKAAAGQVHKTNVTSQKKEPPAKEGTPGFNIVDWLKHNPYVPGIVLFLLSLIIGFIVYKDYGICWDEQAQRGPGLLSYDFVFNGSDDLFTKSTDNHGAGFELLLVMFEKWMNLTDLKDVFEMRHIVTHILFLTSAFAGYVLVYRLFKDRVIACLGFIMLAFAPRLYAHSFFNSKDIPFLAMFLIALAVSQAAFEKNKKWLFVVLGLLCGYATSIRIMGVMLAGFIAMFLCIDAATAFMNKEEKPKKVLINMLLFSLGFCFTLYIAWPYLWRDTIYHFTSSFAKMSHFNIWTGIMLQRGKYLSSMDLPWTYFPIWFIISNPVLWLIAGFCGLAWVVVDFLRRPLAFIRNTNDRNFLLYLLCFATPIFAVLLLHSIIYDDWRHLYFVYPSFVLLGLYFVNKLFQSKYKRIIMAACALQALAICVFMIRSHPFQQVYFNELVSHDKESLRKNYELEYWGCSFKQALAHLAKSNPQGPIKVYSSYPDLIVNNTLLLSEPDRGRIQYVDRDKADYIITNFRNHPYDYPLSNIEYSISVLNSTILCVYKQEADTAKRRGALDNEIAGLNKEVAANPNDHFKRATLGEAYFWNGQYDSSEMEYEQVLAIAPNSLALVDMAGEYFMKNRFPQALVFCKKAIEECPRDINAYVNIGVCYIYLTKYDSAIYYLRSAIKIDPEANGPYEKLAYTYKTMKLTDSAKKYETIAQKNHPEFKL